MLKSLMYLFVKIHQTVSVCEDTLNIASVLSPYNFNSLPQSKRCTVCCATDMPVHCLQCHRYVSALSAVPQMSVHCLLCHRYVSALSAVPQICQCTVCSATDMPVHCLLCHRYVSALSAVPQICQFTVCCATDMSVHCLLCYRYVSALSAVPQMCHSGNVLGFCLKGTRQVEATLIWLNNVTCKETPL